MKTTLKLVAFLSIACAQAHAQVAPAATTGAANLSYALRYSQTAEFGGSSGDDSRSTASGNLDYANGNPRLPFSTNYAGGYIWTISGQSTVDGFFQHLFLSQGLVGRKWNFTLSDNVSYMPAAPVTGFSGIAGEGEPPTGSGPPSSQTVLTEDTHTISNIASGEFQSRINRASTLSAGGSSELLRFPDGNGLDINMLMVNGGLNQRLNARNSLLANYSFSKFSYSDSGLSIESNSTLFGFQRQWNAHLGTSVSVGPQWTSSSSSTTVPSSTMIAADATANYQMRFGVTSLTYKRGVGSGGGYYLGAEVDSISADYARSFRKKTNVGISAQYRRTAGLANNGLTSAKFGGAQVTRRLSRYLTVFGNYTLIDQSTSSSLPGNVVTGVTNEITFGIGYAPLETHLRH